MTDGKILAFRALKPACIRLNAAALQFKSKRSTGKDVIGATESLYRDLSSLDKQESAIDSNLAEYVFIPLSHVFSEAKALPIRAIEVGLQCLAILLQSSWRVSISSDVARQLMLMLGIFAGGNPQEPKTKDVNEELSAAAFKCFYCLFRAPGAGICAKQIVDPDSVPHLSFAMTVLLDGAVHAPSVQIRLTVLQTILTVFHNITDREELRRLFPGVVSTLTRMLSSKALSSYKIIRGSLQALQEVLTVTLSSPKWNDLQDDLADMPGQSKKQAAAIDSWTKGSAGQVKQRLATILPLRYHQREEVREAMSELCYTLLLRCQRELKDSKMMLLDTLIIVASQSHSQKDLAHLNLLFDRYSDLYDILKSTLRDWTISLPRIMQSSDEIRQKQYLTQISTAIRLVTARGSELTILNESIALTLQSSAEVLLSQTATSGVQALSEASAGINQMLQLTQPSSRLGSFQSIISTRPSQMQAGAGLQGLISQLRKQEPLLSSVKSEMITSLRSTTGTEQVASLWLSVQLLSRFSQDNDEAEVSQYLNLASIDDTNHQIIDPFLEETYAFALEILSASEYSETADWRLQALSLETLAIQASFQQSDFRPELVDALFPILERIGSTNTALQHHALTCLNMVSSVCGYQSPKDLIIDNVDYLVNAISLKLNTFDISPQSPRILIMMVKLCGESLIPYLDDLVESIFTILACFHGYPKLVESLFGVLHAVVEEGSKGLEGKMIGGGSGGGESGEGRPKRRPRHEYMTPDALTAELRDRKSKVSQDPLANLDFDEPLPGPSTPPQPPSPSPLDPSEEEYHTSLTTNKDSTAAATTPSKTLSLLTTIAHQTQHHLPTASPSLRLLLLDLLPHAFSALASTPDTFLPIVNDIWPVLITRLTHDSETYILTAAAKALACLCESAGDFLTSRWEAEWEALEVVYSKAERGMLAERKARKSQGPMGERYRVWSAVVDLIVSIVEWVGVTEEMEDGVFDMLGKYVYVCGDGSGSGNGATMGMSGEQKARVRECLEGVNPDRVWYEEEKGKEMKGQGEDWAAVKPEWEGWDFKDVKFS